MPILPQRNIYLQILDKDDNVVDARETIVKYHASCHEWVVFREFNQNGVFQQFILCLCLIELDEIKYHMQDLLEAETINYYLCAYDKSQYKIGKIFEKKCAEYKQMEDEVANGEKVIHYAQEEEAIDLSNIEAPKEEEAPVVVTTPKAEEEKSVEWYKRLWTFIT
jgi:hypothetical protein